MPLFGPNIAKLEAKGDVQGLIAALGYVRDPRVRHGAAQALGRIGDPRAVEPLIATLGDTDPDLYRSTCMALVKIGAPSVEPLRAAQKGEDPDQSRLAAAVLQYLEFELGLESTSAAAAEDSIDEARQGPTVAVRNGAPGGGDGSVLAAFDRALRREGHVLRERPEILWQQLYNRLQWEDERVRTVLAPTMVQRSNPGAIPWLRTRTPSRESAALLFTLAAHRRGVGSCAFSPDGRFLAAVYDDGTVGFWDATSGRQIRSLAHPKSSFIACAFNPDGRHVVAGDRNGTIRVWEPQAGQEPWTLRDRDDALPGSEDLIYACVYSPDGAFVASTDLNSLTVWDAVSGEGLGTVQLYDRHYSIGDPGQVPDSPYRTSACAFSPDRRWIAAGGTLGNALKVWEVRGVRTPLSPAPVQTLTGDFRGVLDCTFSPDGRLLASAHGDGAVRLWDVASGRLAQTLTGHGGLQHACAFSPDGRLVASASSDGTLKLWPLDDGKEVRSLVGHGGGVVDCAFSPDGRLVVSASGDGTMKLWDVSLANEPERLAGHDGRVDACAFSSDGRSALSAGEDETIRRWDAEDGRELRSFKGFEQDVYPSPPAKCAVSADGRLIVSARDMTVQIWEADTGKMRRRLKGHKLAPQACAVSADGLLVVSGSYESTVRLWDVERGKTLATLDVGGVGVTACALSPDCRRVVVGSIGRTIEIWNVETSAKEGAFDSPHSSLTACAFSPDQQFVVCAFEHGAIQLLDPELDRELSTLSGHGDRVNTCTVSPDGRLVVTGSDDSTLRVWDASSGEELRVLPLPGPVWCAGLHRSLPRVVCGDIAGDVRLIDLLGIEYGPLLVTARELGGNPVAQCPACGEQVTVERGQLGQELRCPGPSCGTWLRVNSFVLQ